MSDKLSVADPLAAQTVTIVVTLTPADGPRAGRPALVSLGVADRAPVTVSGAFADLPALIDAAWNTYGVRAQVAGSPAGGPIGKPADADTVTPVAETVAEADGVPATAVPRPAPPPAKPQARNLSLF